MTSFHAEVDACLRHAGDRGRSARADAVSDALDDEDASQEIADSDLTTEADLAHYLRRLFMPLRRENLVLVIALADTSAENIAWLRAAYGAVRFVAVRKEDLIAEIVRRFADRLTDDAIFALARGSPVLSAHKVVTRGQAIVLLICAALFAMASWLSPTAVLAAVIVLMSLVFVATVIFRAVLAWLGARPKLLRAHDAGFASGDASLPVYTILVPLYHEALVLPALARALLDLDYPSDRLDIKLIVEGDDDETAAVADALAGSGPFEVVHVPPSLPRTKPKATNFALHLARGDFTVIYDAEDRPERDQLRKAVIEFRRLPRVTACLQARLAFFNAEQNWLTRLFALDYDLWFGVLLPGLDRIGVPMPLGGTSNHFRTSVLRAIHAWDPFNVTEDADLGIRLAQLGYRVAMLDSTTFEEAPTRTGIWIKQRSRWLKGYMQTWLVHGRAARGVIARVGLGGFLAFQLFIGGAVLSALVNPLLWVVFIASNIWPLPGFGIFPGQAFGDVSAAGLIASNGLLTYLAVCGSKRRGDSRLAPYGLTVTIYWILISIAGYRGFWHLLTKPFHWEKTAHGLSGAPPDAGHA